MLIYADNRLPDPWIVAQIVVQRTAALLPMVAVQPVYMHPFAVAKMVATIGMLHGRQLALNMIAGGFAGDHKALLDPTPHDERYARLVEYTQVIQGLLERSAEGRPLSFAGRHYRLDNANLTLQLTPELRPDIFVSGSSEAGRAAAAALGAVPVHYPVPGSDLAAMPGLVRPGIRVGVIARTTTEAAWRDAEARFPPDRRGQIVHQLAMKTSDSVWHRQLSSEAGSDVNGVYWLRPFRTSKTYCPYLVGSVDEIGAEIARYLRAGFAHFILDIPPDAEELGWAGEVFARAQGLAAR